MNGYRATRGRGLVRVAIGGLSLLVVGFAPSVAPSLASSVNLVPGSRAAPPSALPVALVSVTGRGSIVRVNVDRDLPGRSAYRGVLEAAVNGRWQRRISFSTHGRAERVAFKGLRRGTYRVRVRPNRWAGAGVSPLIRISRRGGPVSVVTSDGSPVSQGATGTDDYPDPKPTRTPTPTPTPPGDGSAGAQLPVTYDLATLGGRSWFVAPTGSDSSGDGSAGSPFRTLVKATAVAGSGDSVVVRGGSYPIAGNAVSISKAGLTVTAFPGEVPVFDGSVPVATDVAAEGDLRSVAYQPIPAGVGEGLGIANLPAAAFSGGQPSALAARRGWRCPTGTSTYARPAPTQSDPDGCSGTPVVISGYWPDQVWVGDRSLDQVADKSRVVPGTFWVERQSATDQAPAATRLFLHREDAANMSGVRVSSSTGNFIRATADRVAIRGLSIKRHSPTWGQYPISVASGVDDFSLRDIALDDNAGISFKLAGGSTAGGPGLIRRPTIERVTVTDGGWMGAVALYTDDLRLSGARFERLNQGGEFAQSPQSGAIKATKVDRMVVSDSVIRDVKGHGLWWDQSAYDVLLARTRLENVSHTSVFFEISHRLTMVDNLVVSAAGEQSAGHTAVRLAGASNARLIGNTIIGSPVGIGVYTEPRSKSWGAESKPCAEHPVRYGQAGDANADCNVSHHSDFDLARSGAYSPTNALNLTPGMTWRPSMDMMINNVIGGQTGPLSSGWTPCGGFAPLCVTGAIGGGYDVRIPMNTIMRPDTLMDGNVYQPAGGRIARFETASGQLGGFVAADLGQLRGAGGLASSFYGLTVETSGRSGDGWVHSDGSATSQLSDIHDQAAPTPPDSQINEWIPAGTRRYGSGLAS